MAGARGMWCSDWSAEFRSAPVGVRNDGSQRIPVRTRQAKPDSTAGCICPPSAWYPRYLLPRLFPRCQPCFPAAAGSQHIISGLSRPGWAFHSFEPACQLLRPPRQPPAPSSFAPSSPGRLGDISQDTGCILPRGFHSCSLSWLRVPARSPGAHADLFVPPHLVPE